MTAALTARARARAELTLEIKKEARRQLAAEGAAGLSLRAVARALGMASSALYRYFPSRDHLLTALIIDAYDDLGRAAEATESAFAGRPVADRWNAVAATIRRWALAHPAEYALVYGSPVPGYRAPVDTIGPASRVTFVLARCVQHAWLDGDLGPAGPSVALSPTLAADLDRVAAAAMPGVPPAIVMRALAAWTNLFGMVSFELFGHLQGVIEDPEAFFLHGASLLLGFVGGSAVAQPAP